MKWFWRVNYFLTVYGVIVFVLGMVVLLTAGNDTPLSNTLDTIFTIISFNVEAFPLTMILEWIQLPLFLIAIIFWKKERTTPHFFYLGFIIFLNFAKWITLFAWLF